MAKKPAPAAKTAAAPKAEAPKSATPPAAKEAKVPLSKMRGPRGVAETAKITLVAKDNPKRPTSKAHRLWELYKGATTVGKFCDAVDATDLKGGATPALVYDASHGFITIEGYNPEIVKLKEKAPPKAKPEPKGKPAPKGKDPEATASVKTEMVD